MAVPIVSVTPAGKSILLKGSSEMKGVAPAGDNNGADYEAIVLAFSKLSHAVISDQTAGGALIAAAETGSVLLQADSGAAFLYDSSTSAIEFSTSHFIDLPSDDSIVPGESIVRQCVETGNAAIVGNLEIDLRKDMSLLARQGVVSILCVPLKVTDRCLGALMVMSSTLRAFSASDIAVLSAIADQAAFAVWKSRMDSGSAIESEGKLITPTDLELIDLANRKIRELSVLNKISEVIISTLDLAELLDIALDQCLAAVGATVGSIMLLNDGGETLSIKVAKGIKKEIISSASVTVGQGIAGWVAEHGQPVLVHDARSDIRFKMRAYRDDISSAMSIPLKAHGRVIGVLNASTTESGRRFGPRDVEFLSTIANQVAMVIDNARLYERLDRRSTELASLLQIAETVTSSLDLKDVLAVLAEKFKTMAQVDAASILVYDNDTERFRCLSGQGLMANRDRRSTYLELAHPIARKAFEIGIPVCVDMGPESPYANQVAAAEGFLSAVCVPLTTRDRFVGVVALFSKKHRAFTGSELRTLAALGNLAGVAIHNSLIYQHKYDIARSFQFQIAPKVPLVADKLEIGHKFMPAREVGGDYYDFIRISPGKAGVVIADVAGNSVSAAVYTSMGRNVLRAYAFEDHTPSDVISKLNKVACGETQPEVFISVFYGVFDSEDHSFRYACAGHEPPILYRPDGSFESLRASGILVGIDPDADYEEKSTKLESGSILVMFTDGVVESPAARRSFGVEQIKEIIAANALKPSQEVADNIFAGLLDVAGDGVQDDVALVVLKVM